MRQKSLGSFRGNGTSNYITNVCQSLSVSLSLSSLLSAPRIIQHQKRIINDSRDAGGSHKSGCGRVGEYLYHIFFLLFCRVNGGLAVRGRSSLKRVKFKLILYLRRRVGHSTSFADPFVFVTARPPTPLSAYKSFRQLGNKRRVLMDLRASAATSIFPLLSFNSFCSKTRHERR